MFKLVVAIGLLFGAGFTGAQASARCDSVAMNASLQENLTKWFTNHRPKFQFSDLRVSYLGKVNSEGLAEHLFYFKGVDDNSIYVGKASYHVPTCKPYFVGFSHTTDQNGKP